MGKSTLFESVYEGGYLPKQVQRERLRRVVELELTQPQREVILAYYVEGKTIPQIARERGVNKSAVSRMLHRGLDRIRRILRY